MMSSLPAVGKIDFEAIRSIQLTVGLLSHRVPIVLCLMVGAVSTIMPTATISADSSPRSKLVRDPVKLVCDTNSGIYY